MQKLRINIPENFINERKYIIKTLFQYLGIEPIFFYHKKAYYSIKNHQKEIIFYDYFFSQIKDNYLQEKYLPTSIQQLNPNKFTAENIYFLYGKPLIQQTKHQVIIYADIFASAFYLLSRWEEYVIKKRDRHQRFPDQENILKKYNLQYIPVVCQYVNLLKKLLKYIDIQSVIRQNYQLYLTHDVDNPRRYDTPITFLKSTVNDILKRKSPKLAIKGISNYLKQAVGKAKDPYDTFDFLMNISEKYNLKSHFYFIPSLKKEPKAFYDYNNKKIIQLVKQIQERGHIIGLHASYRSYNNKEIFQQELERFISSYKIIPEEGRQHFLRFENPTTWQLWEANNLKIDSTVGFYSDFGFRSGICYPYPVFDILKRQTLKLVELPLIVMEAGLSKTAATPESFIQKIKNLQQTIKKYQGIFVLLWHPNSFFIPPFDILGGKYEEVIKILTQ